MVIGWVLLRVGLEVMFSSWVEFFVWFFVWVGLWVVFLGCLGVVDEFFG